MSDIKDRMGSLRAELVVDEVYKQFYKFIFVWARGICSRFSFCADCVGDGEVKKSVPKDMAVELWKLLLTDRFPLLNPWLQYVNVCIAAELFSSTVLSSLIRSWSIKRSIWTCGTCCTILPRLTLLRLILKVLPR
jgi:hypothetical protein